MNGTAHRLSHQSRRSRSLSASALVVLLVAVLGLASVPTLTPASAAMAPEAGKIPGLLIPLLAGPELAQPTIVPEQPRGPGAASTIIQVNYYGFSDEARVAFQRAVNVWASQLTSPVPIIIDAHWEAMPLGRLGSAGPLNFWNDFVGAPQANTYYPNALANKLAGVDLDPDLSDMSAKFNSDLPNWYFGTGATPAGKYNFTSTVLHEIGHGLGFSGSVIVANGKGSWGFGGTKPFIYDRAVYNGAGQQLIAAFTNNSPELAAQYTGGALYFDGTNANAANGGTRPRLYAPSPWSNGGSYTHLDEDTFPAGNANSLMTAYLSPGEAVYDPGPLARAILTDLGWTTVAPSPKPAPSPAPPKTPRYVDVPRGYWAYSQIDQFAERKTTTGCATDATGVYYCPEREVTRAEMAVMIVRTLGVTNPPTPTVRAFADVPTDHWAAPFIEELFRRGITTGCNAGDTSWPPPPPLYCPDTLVKRSEMAVFVGRAKGLHPLTPATPNFADVPATYWAAGWIERFAEQEITTGCGDPDARPRYYCPEEKVKRSEMAVFIIRAFAAP